MKRQTEHRTQSTEHRAQTIAKKKIVWVLASVICVLIFTFHFLLPASATADKWGGVDESVVEKYAEEHGRTARDPFINTDQGDLLLFVFLLAGAVGGFIGGYYWRQLTESRAKNAEHRCRGNLP